MYIIVLFPKDPLKSYCDLFGGDGHWSQIELGFLRKAREAICSHVGHVMHLATLWGKWEMQANPGLAPKTACLWPVTSRGGNLFLSPHGCGFSWNKLHVMLLDAGSGAYKREWNTTLSCAAF